MALFDFYDVRPEWNLPPYPPYHKGLYLEEYFYEYYKNQKHIFDEIGYTLIPIFWTSCYLQGINVQSYIDVLPKDKKYFAVSQHDDAIKEILPEGTIVFSAGGNAGGIPIPLVCSPLPQQHFDVEKDILCSFVGSKTHSVRSKIIDALSHKDGFIVAAEEWDWHIGPARLQYFIDVTRRSKFALAPRGYGAQSFRFYEIMQLGTVPVYVHDDNRWCPFEESLGLDWSTFAIVIHVDDIEKLPDILNSISDEEYERMLGVGEDIYDRYFNRLAVCQQIENILDDYSN